MITEKIHVRFDENDEIFNMSEPLPEWNYDANSFGCWICGKEKSKFTNCQFCGMLNCADCLKNKTRPFPMKNPGKSKRGIICQVCNKKFLYRDAMHEYTIKLEMKGGVSVTQQEELDREEEHYNRLMSQLQELKDQKEQK